MPRAVRLHAIRGFDAFGPFSINETRHPDAHIRVFFRRAAKPCRHEPRGRFDDRRGVDLWVRAGVVDVFGLQNGGIGSLKLHRRG